MDKENTPLLCNVETGICESSERSLNDFKYTEYTSTKKLIKVIYFTDPICSSCWGIEPQLRKMKSEYGNYINIEYHMGGLLPDWSYNNGGISKPFDVARHWDEVSLYYDMPIDGNVWLEEPLHSSYPPSIAFKAAQIQSSQKAIVFLRELREMVFLQKKNITKIEYIKAAAITAGLDEEKLETDYEGIAKTHFKEDLNLAKLMGVRGFPSIVFQNSSGKTEFVYGFKPYSVYRNAISKLEPQIKASEYIQDWESLFTKYRSLTAREYAELSSTERNEGEFFLNKLTDLGLLEKFVTKNGSIWKKVAK